MKVMCLLFGLAASLLSLKVSAESDQRIAVLELSNPARLERQEVQYLSDLLRRLASSELAQSFLVIDKANVLELLPPEKTLEECIGACAVETGRLLQASYIITGDIIKFGRALRVTVRLHDTKTGRLIASEVASGREVMDMEAGIQEAGGRLLRRLIKGSRKPSTEGSREKIGEPTQQVGSLTKRVIVTLGSQPRGASIIVDGVQKCAEGTERCKVELTEGAHQINMTKTDYFMRSGTATFTTESREITWSLDPNFATLRVNTTPSDLDFTINGERHQGAYTQRITPQKSYRVVSSDRCFDVSGEKITAGKPGEEITVNLAPAELFAILDVSARNQKGKPITATVSVDGKELGSTPHQSRVSLCSKELLVRSGPRKYTQQLTLTKGSTARVLATLNLDPDCDVNSYVDSKVGGYFWPVMLSILVGSGGVVAVYYTPPGTNSREGARGMVGLAGGVGLLLSLSWVGVRAEDRAKAFKQYNPPVKCQGVQSLRTPPPPTPPSPRFKLAPTLAPNPNGVTFGFNGTF